MRYFSFALVLVCGCARPKRLDPHVDFGWYSRNAPDAMPYATLRNGFLDIKGENCEASTVDGNWEFVVVCDGFSLVLHRGAKN